MSFILNGVTPFNFDYTNSTAVDHAVNILNRDFRKVFGKSILKSDNAKVNFVFDGSIENAEQFIINVNPDNITARCADELAMVYAILYMSRNYLGVKDFWFWTECEPKTAEYVEIAEGEYVSPVARVRYRGWFVNDEVCLIGWSKVYPPSREIWECVFETLLRLGGNMVIPGTDLPRSGEHFDIATEMGLYITHHHAEPLGGEMFLRAYPDKDASYDKYPELFEKLWADAIEKNKNKKIVWTLGCRGQGDAPFWHNDPKYDTPESRAEVIMRVIDKQYKMICEKVENPVCAVYLYGEITELYEGGYLKLPKKFIKIWSDNGYGKMVTRRQGNHNPRVKSLPAEDGKHGLYYHITFHDLQASSHLSLLANPPEFVNDELDTAFKAGASEYLLLNSGNIRPHIYMLDLVSKIWTGGKADIAQFKKEFSDKYLHSEKAIECYNDYFKTTLKYGENYDDRAGDEFFYHPARSILTNWAKGNTENTDDALIWATGEADFESQIKWFMDKCGEVIPKFEKLAEKCACVSEMLESDRKVFFDDNINFQVKLHLSGAKGLYTLCKAFLEFKENKYERCFVTLTDAMAEYQAGLDEMHKGEHDKWENFYSADWLTNVQVTIYALDSMRKYIRLIDDGPHFFKWFKNNVMPETERQIYLENTQRRTLSDDELAEKLREVLQ